MTKQRSWEFEFKGDVDVMPFTYLATERNIKLLRIEIKLFMRDGARIIGRWCYFWEVANPELEKARNQMTLEKYRNLEVDARENGTWFYSNAMLRSSEGSGSHRLRRTGRF